MQITRIDSKILSKNPACSNPVGSTSSFFSLENYLDFARPLPAGEVLDLTAKTGVFVPGFNPRLYERKTALFTDTLKVSLKGGSQTHPSDCPKIGVLRDSRGNLSLNPSLREGICHDGDVGVDHP